MFLKEDRKLILTIFKYHLHLLMNTEIPLNLCLSRRTVICHLSMLVDLKWDNAHFMDKQEVSLLMFAGNIPNKKSDSLLLVLINQI